MSSSVPDEGAPRATSINGETCPRGRYAGHGSSSSVRTSSSRQLLPTEPRERVKEDEGKKIKQGTDGDREGER